MTLIPSTPSAPRGRRNVFLLAVAQALFVSSAVISITYSGLVGEMLSGSKAMATIPVALIAIGAMAATMPASFLMKRIGRRSGFFLGVGFGLTSAILAMTGISLGSYALFCVAMMFQGAYQAFTQYYRFAAVESVEHSFVSRGISYVLAGGVFAAIAAPQFGVYMRGLFPHAFFGAYVATLILSLLACLPFFLFRNPEVQEEAVVGMERPLSQIAKSSIFITAVLMAAGGYGLMILLMTSTPLVMVDCGYSASTAAFVIQWHVLGMFLPSFFTGTLIVRLGLMPVLWAGIGLFVIAGLTALSGTGEMEFILALTLVGVGWNFLFIGGTTLLTESYRREEKAKVQAVNEFLVLGITSAASLMSGVLLSQIGWDAVVMGVFPVLGIMAVSLLWCAILRKKKQAAEVMVDPASGS